MDLRPFRPPVMPLFVPADRPERFSRAVSSGADAVILDLEDAVAPERKEAARDNVRSLAPVAFPVIVRINARTSPCFEADLQALADKPFSAIMLPKAETAADIMAVHEGLGRVVPVVPLIETLRGLHNIVSILQGSGVKMAAFGSLDFSLELGCEPDWEPLLWARSQIAFYSRLAGLPPPLDGVTTRLDDEAVIEAEARRAMHMGFGGKLAIHPKQIAPIKRAFTPTGQSLAWARKVLDAAVAGGAIRVDGAMVDEPLIARARSIVASEQAHC